MRKFLSLILALSIICSLAIAPVWADDEEGDGTIDPYATQLMASKATIISGKASNFVKSSKRLEGFLAGGYIAFEDVNFDRQPSRVDCHIGLGSGLRSTVEIRLDSPEGKVIASANFKTSDWSKGRVDTLEITEKVKGVHDVYVITVNTTIHFYSFQFYTDEVIEYTSPNLTFNETIRYSDVADSPYYNDIIAALDLGFIEEYDSKEFKPQLPITRYEFAKTVNDIMNLSPTMESYFNDVTAETPNAVAINAVREGGFIKGKTETEFAPYDFVTVLDATVVAVRMLGYEYMVALKGGYPLGYKLVASDLGILNGFSDNEVLRRDTFAKWITDVINASYSDVTSITNDSVHYDNISGLLSKTRKINKGTGVITANQFGSIYSPVGNSLENYINIDGVPYYCENTHAASYLGMNCDYYYIKKNGRYEIISIVPSYRAKIKSIEGKPLKSFDSSSIIYYTDDTKTKEARLKTDGKTVFLINGKAINTSIRNLVSASDFKGQILWIDNNNNTVADVVSLWIPETYELNTVSQNKLADKLESKYNKKMTSVKDSNIKDADIIYYLNGEEVKKSQFPMGTIVQVYQSYNTSGKKVVRIYNMADPITGTITEISKDYVYIAGKPYKADIDVELNDSGSFYIDKYNHIVHFKEGVKATDTIGLFIGAAKAETGAFGDVKLEVKLYTKAAGIAIFQIPEKAIVDGYRISDSGITFDQALNGIGDYKGLAKATLNTPVRIRLDSENNITFIDTLLVGAGNENDTMKQKLSGNLYYRLNAKMFTKGNISYDYPADVENGVSFRMYPETDGTVASDYVASTIAARFTGQNTSIKNTTTYSSKGDLMTDIVVEKNRSLGSYKQALFVTSKLSGLDKEGEPAIRIKGIMNNGQSKTYIISTKAYEATVVEKDANGEEIVTSSKLKLVIDNIKVGDIIRPSFDQKSEMRDLEYIFSNDAKADNGAGIMPELHCDKEANKKVSFYPIDQSHGKQDIFGVVAEKVNGFTKINRIDAATTLNDDGSIKTNFEYVLTAGKNAIIYDCATGDYKKGTDADLEAGDKVVISLQNMIVDSIVVYRNLNLD